MATPTKLPIALQMYTVRDDAARDFAGTLAQVAKIGYVGVELAGLQGLSAPAVRTLLDDNGLFAVGTHTGIDAILDNIGQVIDENLALGSRYVTVPYLGDDRRKSLEDYQKLGATFTEVAAKLKESNLGFCYHNHAFEFDKFGGDTYAFDALFAAGDPNLVKVEMDTFWVKKAGEDPAAYLKKYAGRVPLIHIKDMTAGENPTFAEVGEGTMDFDAIFAAAGIAGGEYYIVEQDQCKNHPPLTSVEISFKNLQKMGMV